MTKRSDYVVDQEEGTVRHCGWLIATFEETQGRNPIECVILGEPVLYCVNIDDMLDHIDEYLKQDF